VASFGPLDARLLVVGLAPGLKGANRTGRPFTGDHAGLLLYATLTRHGFANGVYAADPADGLALIDARITNAVRCVPPGNKPLPGEIATCSAFLAAALARMERLRVIVALGRIAHDAIVRALARRPARIAFGHGGEHEISDAWGRALTLLDSYHCSRYNTQTRRLTEPMFDAVFARARATLEEIGETGGGRA
jgi:uracil-DNA glycosylase family 4